ncbi:MAG: ABC transporter permease [Candidatus Rokuibacteriota bacterium]
MGVPLISGLGDLVVSPYRVLVSQGSTIGLFVRRDVRSRYVNSFLGLTWAVVQPLALLALYTFVFSYVLQVRFTRDGSPAEFALYLFCGMLPWLAFSDGLTRATSVIVDRAPLIKKVRFPSEVLPVSAVVSALVVEALGLAVLLVAAGVLHRGVGWSLLALPVVIGLQLLFTLGLAWLLASVSVLVRDLRHVVGLALTVGMFLTPIMYPPALVPEPFRWVLDLNPMFHVVQAYRDIVLDRMLPATRDLAILAVAAFIAATVGHHVFMRSKRWFVGLL